MSGVHDDLDTIRITVGTANPVANVMACVDRVEAEIARLDRIVSSHISRADRREGMVVAYDYEGEYVGCMGRNTWQWLIDTGVTEAEIDRLREERDMARAGRDQWERFAIGRGVVQYELLARAQAAEAELATATTTAELAIRQLETAEARCALLQQAIDALCSEPTHSGPAHDKSVRVTSYRAIREHFREALAGPDTPADPPCPGCGMTAQVEPSRSEPGRWMCHGCARTFDTPADSQEART